MTISQPALILELTKRDFKIRYLGSVLGMYWNLIHPVVLIGVYTLVFSKLMGAKLSVRPDDPFAYSFYLCAGLLPWNSFNEVVNRCTTALNEQSSFLKKMPLKPIVVLYSSLLSSLVNFGTNITIYTVFLIAFGGFHPVSYLAFLASAAAFFALGFFMGVTLGCINVFLKDIQQVLNIVFQLWFWFTPIIYVKDNLPPFALSALRFNPAFVFVDAFHETLFWNRLPTPQTWLIMVGWLVLFGGLSLVVYRKLKDTIRDEL